VGEETRDLWAGLGRLAWCCRKLRETHPATNNGPRIVFRNLVDETGSLEIPNGFENKMKRDEAKG
jgi:hypothetical protein